MYNNKLTLIGHNQEARRQVFVWGVLLKVRWTMDLLRNKTWMMKFARHMFLFQIF